MDTSMRSLLRMIDPGRRKAMNKRRAIVGAVVLALSAVALWAFGWLGGTDPAVAELQQMGDQMWNQDLPEAQRDQLRDDFRERMRALSDDQRRAFFDGNRDQWMRRVEQRMDEFFALPPSGQQERLDEILDRMQQWRQNPSRNANTRDRGGDRGDERRGRDGWRNMTEAQRDERSKRRLDRTSPKLRAQFSEFRRRLDERSKQRGLGEVPGWGFRGGGRGA
jgi:hypothetical protein